MIEKIKIDAISKVVRRKRERVSRVIAYEITRLVSPKRLILRMRIADNEKHRSGVAARMDSVNTLIPYSALRIGSSGPIRIRPAIIFDEIANIGRPCFNVFFI